jgi:hypothetical protein
MKFQSRHTYSCRRTTVTELICLIIRCVLLHVYRIHGFVGVYSCICAYCTIVRCFAAVGALAAVCHGESDQATVVTRVFEHLLILLRRLEHAQGLYADAVHSMQLLVSHWQQHTDDTVCSESHLETQLSKVRAVGQ